MPLPKRAIVPVNVSNVVVPKEVNNELEYMANATLSNLTRQLASLSLQAADLFSELIDQLIVISNRSERINYRIEFIKSTLSETAIREDDLMIGLISLQSNPYKSRMETDQQVLNINSMPKSIFEVYQYCEPPPALEQLDKFRYDNKQSMKFYTDPNFFFHLWCQEMLQDTKQKKKKKKKRLKKQLPTARQTNLKNVNTQIESNKIVQNGVSVIGDSPSNNKANVSLNGFELPPPLLPSMESNTVNLPQPQFNYEDVSIYNSIVPPNNLPPIANNLSKPHLDTASDISGISPPPPAMFYLPHKPVINVALPQSNNQSSTPFSVNTGVPNDISFRNLSPDKEGSSDNTRTTNIPPPPAPPPPPVSNSTKQNIYAVNAKSMDLLTAIRNGIQLRKVEDTDTRPVPITEAVYKAEKRFDVQAIFEEVYKRRPYADNNSDSDEGTDEDEDSSLWSSDNEK